MIPFWKDFHGGLPTGEPMLGMVCYRFQLRPLSIRFCSSAPLYVAVFRCLSRSRWACQRQPSTESRHLLHRALHCVLLSVGSCWSCLLDSFSTVPPLPPVTRWDMPLAAPSPHHRSSGCPRLFRKAQQLQVSSHPASPRSARFPLAFLFLSATATPSPTVAPG